MKLKFLNEFKKIVEEAVRELKEETGGKEIPQNPHLDNGITKNT